MKRLILAVLATVLLLTLPSFAAKKKDSTTRAVQGTVASNSDEFVDGAVVQLKDTKTLQITSYITKDGGKFHFNGLNPNTDYELKADFQGSSSGSKRLSGFDTRNPAIVNLKLNK